MLDPSEYDEWDKGYWTGYESATESWLYRIEHLEKQYERMNARIRVLESYDQKDSTPKE